MFVYKKCITFYNLIMNIEYKYFINLTSIYLEVLQLLALNFSNHTDPGVQGKNIFCG